MMQETQWVKSRQGEEGKKPAAREVKHFYII
jgi:hypothetical protein